MKVIATKVCCKDLRPGDLFSTAGQDYWSFFDPRSLGERAYIRTGAQCPPSQAEDEIFRLTVERES